MKKETKSSIFLNSVGGVVIISLCVILFNIVTSQFKFKADMTEGDLFTLSEGSKKLLYILAIEREGDDQASQLEIRLYITNDKGVPVFITEHGRKVEDLLDQYKDYAGNDLVLNKINPRQDTEEEDAAISDGMQQLGNPNNGFYVGMAISYLDSTETIPFLDPSPGKAATLEYETVSYTHLTLPTKA